MSAYSLNEHGVPQYPKSHAGRLLITLAAIDHLERATATSVAAFTGLSKGKIDDYVRALNSEFGTSIVKEGPEFRIESWGEILNLAGVKKALYVPINGTTIVSSNTIRVNKKPLMKSLDAIQALTYVMHVDDERNIGNSIIVTLESGWFFTNEPDCVVQGFDTVSEAKKGTSIKAVIQKPIA